MESALAERTVNYIGGVENQRQTLTVLETPKVESFGHRRDLSDLPIRTTRKIIHCKSVIVAGNELAARWKGKEAAKGPKHARDAFGLQSIGRTRSSKFIIPRWTVERW